jgi:hypothetical protein
VRPGQRTTLAEQNEFQKKQIAELVEKYPDVFYIWNDALDPGSCPPRRRQRLRPQASARAS